MKNIFILIIAFLTLYSCNEKTKKQYIAKIDSLLYTLDTTVAIYNKINYDTLKSKNQKYKDMLNVLGNEAGDSITNEEMILMERFSNMKKPFRNFLNKKTTFDKDITYTKNQLISLKYDIKKEKVNKDSITYYLTTEKEAASKLINDLHFTSTKALFQIQEFDSLYPVITKLSKVLHERKVNKLNR